MCCVCVFIYMYIGIHISQNLDVEMKRNEKGTTGGMEFLINTGPEQPLSFVSRRRAKETAFLGPEVYKRSRVNFTWGMEHGEIVLHRPTLGGRFLILNERVTLQVLREGTRMYEWVLVVREEGRILPPCTQEITENNSITHISI